MSKKQEKAFLYFRENNKGTLNIKFGPEEYAKDTKKFTEILLSGVLHCVTFLSNLTADEELEFRERQYENIRVSFNAIFDQSFPDVFEEKKRIMGLENLAIERAESGDEISEEFLEEVDKAKEKIKERSTQLTPEQIKVNNEKFIEDVEDQIELMTKLSDKIKEVFGKEGKKEEEDINYGMILMNIIQTKLSDLESLHTKVVSETKEEKAN